MKKFFKNQYVVGIVTGFVLAIIFEYITPSLPEGKELLKYFLYFLSYTFRYGLPVFGLWFLYKYRPLDKRFVIEVSIFSCLLFFAIISDLTLNTSSKLSSNHYKTLRQSEEITDEVITNLYNSDKEILETIDKMISRSMERTDIDSKLVKMDSSFLEIIQRLISKIDSLETTRK